MSIKKWLLGSMCVSLIWITGCGNAIPDMTPQQSAMVSQYAANLLLTYSGSYDSRLVDTSVPPEEEKETLSDAVQLPPAAQEDSSDTVSTVDDSTADTDEQETVEPEEIKPPAIPVASVLGMDGLDIQVAGFEACDSYPNDESSDAMFFAMNAAPGNQLVVVHLTVSNPTGSSVTFDTIGLKAKYRILLNGTDQHNALVTMLDNDFSAQNKQLEPGSSIDTVLICEAPAEVTGSLSKVTLKVKNGDAETICE